MNIKVGDIVCLCQSISPLNFDPGEPAAFADMNFAPMKRGSVGLCHKVIEKGHHKHKNLGSLVFLVMCGRPVIFYEEEIDVVSRAHP